MNSFIARKARDPTFRFVSTAYLIHISAHVIGSYAGAEMNPLTNPLGSGMTVMAAGHCASAGPAIHARTGSLRTAIWTAVGVPLALVVVGIPIAAAVNGIEATPMTRTMLFAPWYILYFAVTIRTTSRAFEANPSAGHSLLGIYKEIVTGAPRWYGSRALGAVVTAVTGFVMVTTLGGVLILLIIFLIVMSRFLS